MTRKEFEEICSILEDIKRCKTKANKNILIDMIKEIIEQYIVEEGC